jgi:hypothetical protein
VPVIVRAPPIPGSVAYRLFKQPDRARLPSAPQRLLRVMSAADIAVAPTSFVPGSTFGATRPPARPLRSRFVPARLVQWQEVNLPHRLRPVENVPRVRGLGPCLVSGCWCCVRECPLATQRCRAGQEGNGSPKQPRRSPSLLVPCNLLSDALRARPPLLSDAH